MSDILETISAAIDHLCACGCGTPLRPDGPSQWYATEQCQRVHMGQQTTRPWQVYDRPDAYPPHMVDDIEFADESYTWTDLTLAADRTDEWANEHWRGIISTPPNGTITATVTRPGNEPSMMDNLRQMYERIDRNDRYYVHPDTHEQIVHHINGWDVDVIVNPNVPEGQLIAINPNLLDRWRDTFTLDNRGAVYTPRPQIDMGPLFAGVDRAVSRLTDAYLPALRAMACSFATLTQLHDQHQAKRARMRDLHSSYRHRTRRRTR